MIKENRVHGTSHFYSVSIPKKVKWSFQEEVNEIGNMRCNEWKPEVTLALCLPDKVWDGPTFMKTYKTWWGLAQECELRKRSFWWVVISHCLDLPRTKGL